MKIASVNEIKHELHNLTAKELLEICIRVTKYKKENKELISFLLFECRDLQGYIQNVKKEIDNEFAQINHSNIYYIKKTLRKILKSTNRYIRYTASKETEAELLVYYCSKLKSSGIQINKSTALKNIYNNQLKKITALVKTLHEDLQYDYKKEIDELILYGNAKTGISKLFNMLKK